MANLQRMLGALLASRLSGRGGRGGFGRATSVGLGSGMLRGKAGLAALGYLAYRAYRNHQSSQGAGTRASHDVGAAGGGGSQSLGARIGDVIDRFTGGGGQASDGATAGSWKDGMNGAGPEPEPEPEAEAEVSDARALLLIRAMIAAAQADCEISADERARIISQLDAEEANSDDRQLLERELADPKPLDELLREVRDRDTAQQFYLASRAAVDGSAPTQKAYLDYLRQRLGLADDEVEAAENLAT